MQRQIFVDFLKTRRSKKAAEIVCKQLYLAKERLDHKCQVQECTLCPIVNEYKKQRKIVDSTTHKIESLRSKIQHFLLSHKPSEKTFKQS